MLQILLGAQFGDAVSGELPLQGATKPLAIFEPGAAPVRVAIRRIGKVEQRQGAGECAEALNLNLQPSATFAADAADSSYKILGIAPTFDGHDGAARGQRKRRGSDGQRIVARIEQHRLLAGLEESLNGGVGRERIGLGAGGVQLK